jgi:hypothetical protein
MGRDWGSPEIPEQVDLKTMVRMAPKVATRPRWLYQFGKTGQIPDLTAPNLAPPGGESPTFFTAYYEWMTPPSSPVVGGRGLDARVVGPAQRHALHAQGRLPHRRRSAGG